MKSSLNRLRPFPLSAEEEALWVQSICGHGCKHIMKKVESLLISIHKQY